MSGVRPIDPYDKIPLSEQAPTQYFAIWVCMAELLLSDSCEPRIIPDVTLQTREDKTVIVVEIAPGKMRPYYIKSKGMMDGTYMQKKMGRLFRLMPMPCLPEEPGFNQSSSVPFLREKTEHTL